MPYWKRKAFRITAASIEFAYVVTILLYLACVFVLIRVVVSVRRLFAQCMPQSCNIIATWADTQHVHIYDVKQQIAALDTPGSKAAASKPLKSHKHADEGFAMAWSHVAAGHLVTGDCASNILHWSQTPTGFAVDTVCCVVFCLFDVLLKFVVVLVYCCVLTGQMF